MAQEIINTGAAANDGTGDPLRTAFIKTDNNFDQIWAAGPVGTNVRISGNTITTLTVNTDLALSPNGAANVRLNNNTIPGANNTWYLGSASNRWRGIYVNSVDAGNITVSGSLDIPGDLTVGGNLTVEGDTIQIGNIVTDTKTIQLSNTAANGAQANGSGITVGANDNIATFLYDSTSNVWTTNIGATVTGNVTANYFIGNGALLTGVTSYGNANVADYLPTYTGDITANNITISTTIRVGTLGSGNLEIVGDSQGLGPAIKTPGGSGLDMVIEPSGNLYLNADGGEVIVSDQTPSVDANSGALKVLGGIGVNGNINADGNISAGGWTGNLIPSANAVYSLGNATNRWSNIYLTGNTIFLGSANISTTESGTVAIPGVSVAQDQPSSIEYTGSAPYNDDGVFPSTPVIVDYLTWYLSNPAATAEARAGFVPAVYAAQMSGGNIIGVDIVSPGIYNGPNAATLNTDNMLALPAGTPLTYSAIWAAAQAAVAPFGPFRASVLSTTTVVASSPALYVGGVALAVEAGNVLTVNGEPVLSNDSDATITTTGNLAAGNILTDNYLYANGEPFVSASTGNITFTDTTMSPPDGVDITISAANSEVIIEAFDIRLDATDDLRLTGNDIVSLRNRSTTDPITLRTDYDNNDYVWEFAANGTLTTPGDIVTAGDVTGTAGASTLYFKAQPASNTYIQLNNSVDSVISTVANLEVRTDVDGTAKQWLFDTNGDLTIPNYVQFAGSTYIGDEPGGGSPAFRIVAPLTYGATIETDSDISGNSWTWTFGVDGVLGAPGNITAVGYQTDGNSVTLGSGNTGLNQGINSVAIGYNSGNAQGFSAVAIGYNVGNAQGNGAVAIGNEAGFVAQGVAAVAIGAEAGSNAAGEGAVAVGYSAGYNNQASNTVAVGREAARNLNPAGTQGEGAVAVGAFSGWANQGPNAVAIGYYAALSNQGIDSIAIGAGAGTISGNVTQAIGNNSIILNATGANFAGATANAFYVNPVRNDVGNVSNVVTYNTTTKEVTYTNTISVGGNITGANLIATGNVVGNVAGYSIGYRDIPQVSFTGNTTMAAADAGKHFYSTESTDYVLTIADNSAVSWPVGTAITVVNRGTANIAIAQASGVSLYLAGNSTAGNRTVTTYGMATLLNVAANVWMINGTGVI